MTNRRENLRKAALRDLFVNVSKLEQIAAEAAFDAETMDDFREARARAKAFRTVMEKIEELAGELM